MKVEIFAHWDTIHPNLALCRNLLGLNIRNCRQCSTNLSVYICVDSLIWHNFLECFWQTNYNQIHNHSSQFSNNTGYHLHSTKHFPANFQHFRSMFTPQRGNGWKFLSTMTWPRILPVTKKEKIMSENFKFSRILIMYSPFFRKYAVLEKPC